MDQDREAQRHRLRNKEKSDAAKIAWKRHHSSYMSATRKKERENMNSLYKELNDKIEEALSEATVTQDNVFRDEIKISLDNIAGGISIKLNKDTGKISISTSLEQTGAGMYGLTNFDDATIEQLQKQLKDSLLELCQTFDDGITQITNQYGLRSTK